MNYFKQEAGRSMVEMLGVLAVIGVLSVAGVAGYKNAMNKHRANELLNEASKRATTVAAQISMRGQEVSAAMIGEFTNPTGYTFGVAKKNENQFNITIDAVDEDICQQMKAAAGTNTQVRKINDGCTELTYNNDMSTTVWASDFSDDTTGESCTEAGFKWCSGAATAHCATDCCADVTLTECQVSCDSATGAITNVTDGTKCDYNGGTQNGVCQSGVCEKLDGKACINNTQCGGNDSGYFCAYYTPEKNKSSALKDNSKPTTEIGQCFKVSDYAVEGTDPTTSRHFVWSTRWMDWWSAENFCAANHRSSGSSMKMMSLGGTGTGGLSCPYTAAQYKSSDGYCCASQGSGIGSGCSNAFSAGVTAVRGAGGPTGNIHWLQDLYSYSYAFTVRLVDGKVSGSGRRNGINYPLCE